MAKNLAEEKEWQKPQSRRRSRGRGVLGDWTPNEQSGHRKEERSFVSKQHNGGLVPGSQDTGNSLRGTSALLQDSTS